MCYSQLDPGRCANLEMADLICRTDSLSMNGSSRISSSPKHQQPKEDAANVEVCTEE